MRKLFLNIVFILFAVVNSFAQAPVPTSWDFESIATQPAGWTINNLNNSALFYSGSTACSGNQSLRLDATNESLVIFLGSQPGSVTYTLRAALNSGQWSGTFRVQESVNGAVWVNMASYTGSGAIPTTCSTYTVTPANIQSRYIRFFYENKVTGSNLAIDNVSIAEPVNNFPTLSVRQNTNPIFHNGYSQPFSAPVSGNNTVSFTFRNSGNSGALNINSISFNGIAASEYSLSSPVVPFSINPLQETTVTVLFSPTTAGTRNAQMTINSNDNSTTNFNINLYGVGGDYATAPTAAVSNVICNEIKSYRHKLSFNAANPAPDYYGGYLVLQHQNTPATDFPVNGTEYKKGQNIGTAKVVYVGKPSTGTFSFYPSGIRAGITYYYSIYTYNGKGNVTSYFYGTVPTASATTPNTMQSWNYYSNINVYNASFLSDLTNRVNPHTAIPYSDYVNTILENFEAVDTFVVSGSDIFTRTVYCAYSGEARPYNPPLNWTALNFSREHTYSHSWFPTNPANNPELPEYNDQHNLYPTRQTQVNATRCNYPLGNVVTVEQQYLLGKLGLDANGRRVYEPRNEHKGRAARAMMYMAIAYNGINGKNWKFPNPIGNCSSFIINYGQDQNVIKDWHFQYPPDSYERARNDYLDSLQGNRNPFIDKVNYPCFIDFETMTYISNPPVSCILTGMNLSELPESKVLVFPNPANRSSGIYTEFTDYENTSIALYDISGRLILKDNLRENYYFLNVENVQNGVYLIKIFRSDMLVKTEKLIVK
jgi:endonuclease I